MRVLALAALVCLMAAPSYGFEKLFAARCKEAGVPKAIAIAIAKQESALNPLCVNVAGEDFWPETKAEATRIIREAQTKSQSFDVGLMQINSQWIKRWGMDPVDLLSPDLNIRCGLRILKQEFKRHGVNWRAIANYHSPDPERGRRYAAMVYSRLRGGAELRAMLSNPRLRANLLLSRRYRNLKIGASADASLLRQANSQRKPVGVN